LSPTLLRKVFTTKGMNFLDPRRALWRKVASNKVVLVIVDGQKGMADYYPLISRTVGTLDKPSIEARRALYDRARVILAEQLQRIDPPLSETNAEHERLALEDAIGKVEADAILGEAKWPIPNGLQTQSDDGKSRQQSQPADNLKQLEDYFAAVKASMAPPDAKQLRERHLRRLGNVLLWASILIAGGWIWMWKDVTPDDRPFFWGIGGVIFLIGLAGRYVLAGGSGKA